MIEGIIYKVPVSIIAFNRDRTIVFANPSAERLLGLKKYECRRSGAVVTQWQMADGRHHILLNDLWSRLPQLPGPHVEPPVEEFELEWNPDKLEPKYLLFRCQGLQDEDGVLTGWSAVILNNTEQKNTESKLRESESFYRTLFEHGGFGIALVEPDTGRRVAFNRKLHERLGYTREEYENLTVADIQFDAPRENAVARGKRAIRDGAFTFEERQRTKDGKPCHVLVSAVPVTIGGKELIHAISLDVTEKRQLEIELRQAQKMEAVGRLAGGVAHDFNNMLNVMIGYTDLSLLGLATDSQLYKNISEIRKAAVRSAELTKQLLAFSRKQIITPQVVQLNDQITDQFEMMRRLIGEEIQIDFRPALDLWSIKIDPGQIHQVLTNLLANARDAIDGVGKISIETANVLLSDEDGYVDLPRGDYVRISVKDTGQGMDANTLEHIFEPFFTTKAAGKGTGLGLATVYGIAKQNDGGVHVHSEPGRGTTINLYFPRFTGDVRQHDATNADGDKARAMAGKRPGEVTIVVVEDEPSLLELTTTVLKRNGFKVIGAGKPSEAIDLCRKYQGDIHLLITDVLMPEMNGRELQDQIQAIYPQLKTLFMSGYSADIVSSRGVIEQGVNFIKKPFGIKKLTHKVWQALEVEG